MVVKPILRATVGIQSLALLGRAVQLVPKRIGKPMKPLKQSKKIVRGFTDILVGTSLLKPTARLVESL